MVDTNVVAYLLLNGPHTAQAEALLAHDPDWVGPPLWRSELRIVLAARGARIPSGHRIKSPFDYNFSAVMHSASGCEASSSRAVLSGRNRRSRWAWSW